MRTIRLFTPGTDCGGSDGDDGRAARYLEWTWDPDSNDSWVQTEYAFLLRSADSSMQVIRESHRTGLFARDVWLRVLAEEGFDPGDRVGGDERRPPVPRAVPCAATGVIRRASRPRHSACRHTDRHRGCRPPVAAAEAGALTVSVRSGTA